MNEEIKQVRQLLAKALDIIDKIEQGKEPTENPTRNDATARMIINNFSQRILGKSQQGFLYAKIKDYIGCEEKMGQALKRLGYLSTYTTNIEENWNDLYIQKISDDIEGEI